jgi:hypothetical protein
MDQQNPYAAPPELDPTAGILAAETETAPPEGVWRNGKLLVMRRDAELPDWCVKTGMPALGRRHRRRLIAHSGWLTAYSVLLLLYFLATNFVDLPWFVGLAYCGPLTVASLCHALIAPRVNVELGYGDLAKSRVRARAGLSFLGMAALMLLLFTGRSFLPVERLPCRDPVFVLFLLGSLLLGLVNYVSGWSIAAARIDDNYVWLRNVHPDYLDMLPEWPGDQERILPRSSGVESQKP